VAGRQSMSIADAYAILEIGSNSSDKEVKKAYRRMMSRHHPDKLVAKGLPEEMMKIATEKTQEIQAAYEIIKKSR
jgi:DnaJ like chaperone protein